MRSSEAFNTPEALHKMDSTKDLILGFLTWIFRRKGDFSSNYCLILRLQFYEWADYRIYLVRWTLSPKYSNNIQPEIWLKLTSTTDFFLEFSNINLISRGLRYVSSCGNFQPAALQNLAPPQVLSWDYLSQSPRNLFSLSLLSFFETLLTWFFLNFCAILIEQTHSENYLENYDKT